MKTQLLKFRQHFLESLLDMLWKQWSALGVAGYGELRNYYVADPEALLLFTCSIGRYDQRLFDEMLDWLDKNERFISIQRLRMILSKEQFSSGNILGAVAAHMAQKNLTPKWRRLADAQKHSQKKSACENLFFLKNGDPMPQSKENDKIFMQYGYIRNPVQNRGLALAFRSKSPQTLLLQMRSLFGIGARTETLLYLFLNGKASISQIAAETYYSWRSIQDVLFEMGYSGQLYFPEAKRGRFYRLDGKPWLDILLGRECNDVKWLCWPPLFRSLEMIWEKLHSNDVLALSPLAQSVEFQTLMREEIFPRLEHAGLGSINMALNVSVNNVNYLDVFQRNIDEIFKLIS